MRGGGRRLVGGRDPASLIRLDADLLATILAGWLGTRAGSAARPRGPRYRQVIAVDGKTVRGARRAGGRQVHLLSALDTSTGVVLAQITAAAKSNEIPALTPLLNAFETVLGSLNGLLFVADALHTLDCARHRDRRAGRLPADPGQR